MSKGNQVFKKLLLLMTLLVLPALANTASEIAHLMNYVKKTECTYIRNGTEHSGVDAAAHIQKKYDYFNDKGQIKTAEDFIRLSATKSTMSGKKYMIACPGEAKVESGKWLLAELKRFRTT